MENIVVRKERCGIQSLEELMPYSAAQINKNTGNKLVMLKWKVVYRENVSCSHNAPIGQETNWGRRKNRPTSFPGWTGRIWLFYSKDPNGLFDSNLRDSLLHSGTGGYGMYDIGYPQWDEVSHPRSSSSEVLYKGVSIYPVSYDLEIFAGDLPGIKAHNLLTNQEMQSNDTRYYENVNHEETIFSRVC